MVKELPETNCHGNHGVTGKGPLQMCEGGIGTQIEGLFGDACHGKTKISSDNGAKKKKYRRGGKFASIPAPRRASWGERFLVAERLIGGIEKKEPGEDR